MATMHIAIEDDVEERFRKEIGKRMGAKKGNIKIALEEAINQWIERKGKL